jgi:hypothetical protein
VFASFTWDKSVPLRSAPVKSALRKSAPCRLLR